MRYMQTGQITEIGNTDRQKYKSYKEEYIPFIRRFGNEMCLRELDKSLFAFGKFLKTANRYV